MPIRIILLFIAALMLVRLNRKFLNNEIRWSEFALWLLFWVAFGVVVIFPEVTSFAATRLGVGRGADLAVYLAIVLLFYLIFKVYVKVEKIDKDMTKIVRALALQHPTTERRDREQE